MLGAWYVLPAVIGALLGVVGTVVGGILTYKANRANAELNAEIQRRSASGSIETSNANELWQENQRLIERLIKEIDWTKQSNDKLRDDVKQLRDENLAGRIERDTLRDENKNLTLRVHELELEVVRLRQEKGSPIGTVTRIVETVTAKADTPPDADVSRDTA